jgi:hypothetical protein
MVGAKVSNWGVVASLVISLAFAFGFQSAEAATSSCLAQPKQITIRLINGVDTNLLGAFENSNALSSNLGFPQTADGTQIRYKPLFNPTEGPLGLSDFIETFSTTADIDPKFRDRIDLMRDVYDVVVKGMTSVVPNGNPLLSAARLYLENAAKQAVKNASAGFEPLIREFRDKVQADIDSGETVIVVGHSQGNIFANRLKELLPPISGRLEYFHVAPPVSVVGRYLLNEGDFVVNAAKLIGFNPPDANLQSFGHSFVDSYLNVVPELVKDNILAGVCDAVVTLKGDFYVKSPIRYFIGNTQYCADSSYEENAGTFFIEFFRPALATVSSSVRRTYFRNSDFSYTYCGYKTTSSKGQGWDVPFSGDFYKFTAKTGGPYSVGGGSAESWLSWTASNDQPVNGLSSYTVTVVKTMTQRYTVMVGGVPTPVAIDAVGESVSLVR